jgi:lactoylglutathione lyase
LAAAHCRRIEVVMTATLQKAFGYQGDNMHLPVKDLAAALPFYENVLGFRVLSRSDTPYQSAVLGRDEIQMGLEESGGDPSQDGCAFHVEDLDALFAEFTAKGLAKQRSEFDTEKRDGVPWRVFFVVAPDGLCYWFGERQAG